MGCTDRTAINYDPTANTLCDSLACLRAIVRIKARPALFAPRSARRALLTRHGAV